eukprot:217527_1
MMKLGIMMIFGVLLMLTKVLFVDGLFDEPCPCNPCGSDYEHRNGGVQTCWCYMCSAKKKNPDICSPISIDTVYQKKSGYSFTWEDKTGMTQHSIATVVTSAEPKQYDGVDVTNAKGAVYPKAIEPIYGVKSDGIKDAIRLKDMTTVNQPIIDQFIKELCPHKKAPYIHMCAVQMKCFNHDITKQTKMRVNPLAITHSSTIVSKARKQHYNKYMRYHGDLLDELEGDALKIVEDGIFAEHLLQRLHQRQQKRQRKKNALN